MRGAVRDFDEYILELQPEVIVGLDVVAHVIVLEYSFPREIRYLLRQLS